MNARLAILLAVFLPFLGWSLYAAEIAGPLGFLDLALREAWGMQMLLDVGVSMGLFCAWMFPDARARGVTPWPWAIACFALGSIGALGYLVARELGASRPAIAARGSA